MQRVEMRFGDQSADARKVRVRGDRRQDGGRLYLLSSRKALHVAHGAFVRRALATLAVVLVTGLVLAATCAAQDVYIRSLTPVISVKTVKTKLPGFQRGVQDYLRWWGGGPVTLRYGTAPAWSGAYQMTISPSVSVFYSGYHSIGPFGPYARVFTDVGGPEWQVTLTHELFEMLADPYIVRSARADRLYLVEVADPVEAYWYYRLGNVAISDFVGPDWYTGGHYFDFMHLVTKPHQLLRGGYVSYWDGVDWAQIFAP
jgi:hypothetical protein